jgi:molybdenum cofactor cytidylyltransferase
LNGAVILAAGFSSRFGSDKRLHSISVNAGDPIPMACATAGLYLQAFTSTVVVLRANDQAMESRLREMFPDIQTVTAVDSELGMGHSLAAGIAAVADWEYAFVGLADMPFVREETLAQLNDRMTQQLNADPQSPAIIQPVCAGQSGHPVGFSHHYFSALMELRGDQGARQVVKNARHQLLEVAVDDDGVLKDLDRPD